MPAQVVEAIGVTPMPSSRDGDASLWGTGTLRASDGHHHQLVVTPRISLDGRFATRSQEFHIKGAHAQLGANPTQR